MLHNEHLRKADESYEIRHDDKGNVIHVYYTDGEALIFPTLHDLVRWVYFSEDSERFYCSEEFLSELYSHESYEYYTLKKYATKDLKPNQISIDVCYYKDELGNKVYDYQEMQDQFELELSKLDPKQYSETSR